MNVIINIFPKKEVLDPETEAVKKSLVNLGFKNIETLSLCLLSKVVLTLFLLGI